MMEIPDLYFWEAEVNPHKLPLFRAMGRRPEVGKAVYIAQRDLNAAVKVKEGAKVAKPADPVREGYVFGGWLLNGEAYDSSGIMNVSDKPHKGVRDEK